MDFIPAPAYPERQLALPDDSGACPIAGTCRYVWNHCPAGCQRRHALWKDYPIGPQPSVSFFTLGKPLHGPAERP